MNILTRTPRKAWQLALIAFVVYISAPFFSIAYYSEMLRKGAYAHDADSIGIPIYENESAAIVLAPVFCAIVLLMVWRYPGSVPLLIWNSSRPVWSWVCTSLFTILIALTAAGFVDVWQWRLPIEFVNIALWIWLLLQFRAVVVARPSPDLVARDAR